MATTATSRVFTARPTTIISLLSQSRTQLLPFLVPFVSVRHASVPAKTKKSDSGKKKKSRTTYIREDMKLAKQFALCDAMR